MGEFLGKFTSGSEELKVLIRCMQLRLKNVQKLEEYRDISQVRFQILKEMSCTNSPNCHHTAVEPLCRLSNFKEFAAQYAEYIHL